METGKVQMIVKPVPRQSVQGRHLQSYRLKAGNNEIVADMRKTKVSNATETLVLRRSANGTRYNMGLEELIPNPFGNDATDVMTKYNLSEKWLEHNRLEKVLKNDSISVQTYLEILAGVDPDTYSPIIKKGKYVGAFIKEDTELTEIEALKVVLYDSANIFTSDTARGRLIMQFLRNHAAVAKTRDEINPNVHRWYIAEEHEDAVEAKKTNDLINEAIAELYLLTQKQPFEVLYQFGTVLTENNNSSLVKGKTVLYNLEEKLNKFIKDKTKYQVANIRKFLEAVNLRKANPELFHIEVLVQAGLTYDVLSVSNGFVYWDSQKHNQELYKFTSLKSFKEFLFAEYNKHNPKEKGDSIYKLYVNELVKRGYEYSGNAL